MFPKLFHIFFIWTPKIPGLTRTIISVLHIYISLQVEKRKAQKKSKGLVLVVRTL